MKLFFKSLYCKILRFFTCSRYRQNISFCSGMIVKRETRYYDNRPVKVIFYETKCKGCKKLKRFNEIAKKDGQRL